MLNVHVCTVPRERSYWREFYSHQSNANVHSQSPGGVRGGRRAFPLNRFYFLYAPSEYQFSKSRGGTQLTRPCASVAATHATQIPTRGERWPEYCDATRCGTPTLGIARE
jgi:hypothetical protein